MPEWRCGGNFNRRYCVIEKTGVANGFTLIEMLLVLAVLMTVVSIAIPSYRVHEARQEEQRFFQLLLHDIYFAQSESYRLESSVMVAFRESSQSYEVVTSLLQQPSVRKLPKTVSLKKTSNLTEIYYGKNGTASKSGTLRFETSTGERTLTVYLGKGRVVLSE
ncbi:competence type IV pilus minor pilin ComGD [Planococcus shixiaomingii]|uniref:competence type IV pilus minor pilin ComGD n=1 Tax=Planococcus shixiaomingii TaxID=3058393 RepID=UPI00260899A9|nr:competence type IV pilus minor pilin ComGD [Planococcus sp. N022]WKA56378.1 competence type IV pilus minor pilin ComGD [Planococcus sp. N022]